MKTESVPLWFAAAFVTASLMLGTSDLAWAQKKTPPAANRLPAPHPESLKNEFPGDSLRTLKNATTFVLFSLNPGPRIEMNGEPVKKREVFHGYDVLGKVTLNGSQQQRAIATFYDAIVRQEEIRQKNPGAVGIRAGCFDPRHGIRAVDATTGKRVDIVICFSCGNAYLHRGVPGTDERNDTTTDFDGFGAASYKYFDALFRKYGVPLAP